MTDQPVAPDDTPPPPPRAEGMVPARSRRRSGIEQGLMRVIATFGIVAIATALAAILVGQDVSGWVVGMVTSIVSLGLAATLWSSNQL